jgi:hypothetical protein
MVVFVLVVVLGEPLLLLSNNRCYRQFTTLNAVFLPLLPLHNHRCRRQGIVPELSLDALVDSYCHLDRRPATQHQISGIIDRLLYMHRGTEEYIYRGPLLDVLLVWHPEDYESCLFNPHVMMSLLRTKYFQQLFIRQRDPTRAEYIRFLLRMLSWRPQPTMPLMGFDVGAFRLLLCHLLASERDASTESFSQIASAATTAGNRASKHMPTTRAESGSAIDGANATQTYRINYYADITLSTWLDIVAERSHGPEGAAIVAMHNLIEFTNTNPADDSTSRTQSARVIVDRIAERDGIMENICLLLSDRDDTLASLTCHLMRNMLLVKPVIRNTLVNYGILPQMFSVLVPAERIHNLMDSFAKNKAKALQKEKTSRGKVISPGPSLHPRSQILEQRVNPQPFHDLGLVVEVVSLLEILAEDPRIKKRIYALSRFAGAPYVTHHGRTGRPSFYALSLLLHKDMPSALVPGATSESVRAAAIVPLHVMVFRAFSALCRFDRQNKIAIASIIVDDLIRILAKTHSNALHAAMLECMHSIATEFTLLERRVRNAFATTSVHNTLKRLADNVGNVQVGSRIIHGSSLAKKIEVLVFKALKR